MRAGWEWGWNLVPGTCLLNRMTHHPSTVVKHSINQFPFTLFWVTYPAENNTAQFLKCTEKIYDKTSQELWFGPFWPWTHIQNFYFVNIGMGHLCCHHPQVQACLTPQIFETWLHSFSMNSCSTCPLHPTHLNHKASYHGNDTQGPVLVQRPNEHAPGGSTGVWRTMFPGGGSLGHSCHGGPRRWAAARSDNLSWGSNLLLSPSGTLIPHQRLISS